MFNLNNYSSGFNLNGDIFSVCNIKIILEVDNKQMELSIVEKQKNSYAISIHGTGIKGVLNTAALMDMLTINIEIVNDENIQHSIGKCYFLHDTKINLSDTPDAKTVIMIPSGSCGFNKIIRLNRLEGNEIAKIFSTINRIGKGGVSFGFISFDRCFCNIEYIKSDGLSETYFIEEGNEDLPADYSASAYCDFNSYILKPGNSLTSETFFIEESTDPYRLPESFADTVQSNYSLKPRQDMPIGWVGGWNYRDGFSQENIEKLMMQNIAAINDRLNGFGVKYIWVSTLNLKNNLPGNWNLDNFLSFPQGLKYITEYCNKNGLEAALWIAPFWMNIDSDNLHLVESAIAVKEGEKVISKFGFSTGQLYGNKKREELSPNYFLDPTHPDYQKFIKETFEYYNEIGIRYFMVDFLDHGLDKDYDLYNKSLINGPESYRSAMQLIHETADDETYLLSSSGPTHYNIGVCDGIRAGLDFGEGRPYFRFYPFYPANYQANNFVLIEKVIRDYCVTYFNHKKLYINDCFNMLSIGAPVSKNEARVVCSMFGLAANPLMMGDDLPSLPDERLSMIKKLLPLHDNAWIPCDLFDTTYPDTPCVFKLDICKDYDSYKVISVFNYSSEPLTKGIDPAELFGEAGEFFIYDFWNEHCTGKTSGIFECHVPPRDVKVMRLTKAKPHPWVIGSDMHITQGDMEIASLRWDPIRMSLKGVCKRPAGEDGTLYINIPKGYEPVDFRELFIVQEVESDINYKRLSSIGKDDPMTENMKKDATIEKLIIATKRLHFDVETTDFNILFRKMKQN